MAGWSVLEWLALIERELLLFAGIFFLIGAIDEFLMDGLWGWMKLADRKPRQNLRRADMRVRELSGMAAVFIPAWQEDKVIGHTIAHALDAWAHRQFVLYVGCYRNDMCTLEAAMKAAGADRRVRLVVHDCNGPSTKADCLNRLYRAMATDELRMGERYRMVLLHDAEDLVDPAELGLMDKAIEHAEFVQIPVLPLPQRESRWIGSHYCEEFAEAHAKSMVVRNWLDTCLPAAGVGCALNREMLAKMAKMHGDGLPFSIQSLTEDYELGMRVKAVGGRSRFLRVRDEDGTLVATRAYFPSELGEAVRQKARWVHGIGLQGWERLGWEGGLAERWMRLRDRRGPLAALVLACGYAFFLLAGAFYLLGELGIDRPWKADPLLAWIIGANLASFAWRALMRFGFTAREYGIAEGLLAVLRIPVANVIAIMSGRRALMAYLRTLRGAAPKWEKTVHDRHPAGVVTLLAESSQPVTAQRA
ncbi:glycosyl transferase family protein [Alteraurantiacibacter aquimixticola]|uniref:Glycosyl transferase family protein n=1 Tax=Alteraurantiacibacter aquimixticola TaxID=2489173 RepID=A0A4T3F2F1_9SPHN|nr:glycosyl transferase family protein [Alteraurantiacibacter aquimixticola]TIX51288.1 glycosyl transferase family protein [Alteraurantiacibacter aquimixticola]